MKLNPVVDPSEAEVAIEVGVEVVMAEEVEGVVGEEVEVAGDGGEAAKVGGDAGRTRGVGGTRMLRGRGAMIRRCRGWERGLERVSSCMMEHERVEDEEGGGRSQGEAEGIP